MVDEGYVIKRLVYQRNFYIECFAFIPQ